MQEVEKITFSHMRGGKTLFFIFAFLATALVIVSTMLLLSGRAGFIALISIFVANVMVILVACKTYKPGLTKITFEGDKIISKSGAEWEELKLKDIEGIWYSNNYHLTNMTFTPYTPNDKKIKGGSLVILGNLESFNGAEFITMNNLNVILKDCFWQGYTTMHYRKSLKTVLDYYYQQIS